MCVNSEGSGETAQMCRLAWAFTSRLCGKYHNLMSWLKSFWLLVYREQLRQFRSSLLDVPNIPPVPPAQITLSQDRLSGLPALERPLLGVEKFSTDERLHEQKEWLRKFQQDLSFGASLVKAPGSDAGSMYPLWHVFKRKIFWFPDKGKLILGCIVCRE